MKSTCIFIVILLAGCERATGQQVAPPPPPGFTNIDQLLNQRPRYQLTSDSAGHVWKMDTTSGDVWMCAIGGAGTARCYVAATEPKGAAMAGETSDYGIKNNRP